MRAAGDERRATAGRILRRALIGLLAPPLVVAGVVWSLATLSGMQRPELTGLWVHLTGGSLPVEVVPTALRDEATIDQPWFAATTQQLATLGLEPSAERVVRRGAYRGWVRLFAAEDPGLAAFARQTTYPGAPPPNVAFVSACSPGGGGDEVAGATLWVETSDEVAPPGDTGTPPFLRVALVPDVGLRELLGRHAEHVARACGGAERLPVNAAALTAMIRADRLWWFDWCAQSLVGMAADCRPQE